MLYSEFCFIIVNHLNNNDRVKCYIMTECSKDKSFDFSLLHLFNDDIKNKLNSKSLKLFYYLMLYKIYFNNHKNILINSSDINKIEFKRFIDVDLKPCIYDTQSNGILSLTINYIENKQIRKLINRRKLDFNIIEMNDESVSPISDIKQIIMDLNEIICYLTKNLII